MDNVLIEAKATYYPFSTLSPEGHELTEVPIYADCLRDLIGIIEQCQKRVKELEGFILHFDHDQWTREQVREALRLFGVSTTESLQKIHKALSPSKKSEWRPEGGGGK